MNPYRQRILPVLLDLIRQGGPVGQALDFGSGDGWFAQQMMRSGLVHELTLVDIKRRETILVEPQLYDGIHLPFADRSFDLVYSVDVLHHCPDPVASLQDLLRCSRRFLLLKDHTWTSKVGKFTLAVLDEIGNQRFGVPSPYQYQRSQDWFPTIESAGFRLLALIHPLKCHSGLLGYFTNPLQFVAMWERTVA